MFDIFAHLLSSIASFLFPLFASYKALKTSDPAQLTPWLMYWVVLACALLVESWTEWILVWIPFYAYIRLFFLLYLVLPQTQGARIIYQTHVHPFLQDNEAQIEEFISEAHDRLKAAGIAYLKRAIELIKTNDLSKSGNLIPPELQGGERTSFIAAQRERLAFLLKVLEREAAVTEGQVPGRAGSMQLDGADDDEPTQRPMSAHSGLSKSRSETDFEKIDAESGAEDQDGEGTVRRRQGGGSSWMPFGWGSTPTAENPDGGSSSGVQK
uniref:Protein YOP1 n=1 Tax=Colletotrichum fructicola (strain Nara gc5) TaxID=1213859 RepID=L2GGK1_COLFN